jgi:hypothetical protein
MTLAPAPAAVSEFRRKERRVFMASAPSIRSIRSSP